MPTEQLRALSKKPEDPEVLAARLHRFIHQGVVPNRSEHELEAYTQALGILRKELKGKRKEGDASVALLFVSILQTLAGGHVNQLPVAPGAPIPQPALYGLPAPAAAKLKEIGLLAGDFGSRFAAMIKPEERRELGRLCEHFASYAGARGSNAFAEVALRFA